MHSMVPSEVRLVLQRPFFVTAGPSSQPECKRCKVKHRKPENCPYYGLEEKQPGQAPAEEPKAPKKPKQEGGANGAAMAQEMGLNKSSLGYKALDLLSSGESLDIAEMYTQLGLQGKLNTYVKPRLMPLLEQLASEGKLVKTEVPGGEPKFALAGAGGEEQSPEEAPTEAPAEDLPPPPEPASPGGQGGLGKMMQAIDNSGVTMPDGSPLSNEAKQTIAVVMSKAVPIDGVDHNVLQSALAKVLDDVDGAAGVIQELMAADVLQMDEMGGMHVPGAGTHPMDVPDEEEAMDGAGTPPEPAAPEAPATSGEPQLNLDEDSLDALKRTFDLHIGGKDITPDNIKKALASEDMSLDELSSFLHSLSGKDVAKKTIDALQQAGIFGADGKPAPVAPPGPRGKVYNKTLTGREIARATNVATDAVSSLGMKDRKGQPANPARLKEDVNTAIKFLNEGMSRDEIEERMTSVGDPAKLVDALVDAGIFAIGEEGVLGLGEGAATAAPKPGKTDPSLLKGFPANSEAADALLPHVEGLFDSSDDPEVTGVMFLSELSSGLKRGLKPNALIEHLTESGIDNAQAVDGRPAWTEEQAFEAMKALRDDGLLAPEAMPVERGAGQESLFGDDFTPHEKLPTRGPPPPPPPAAPPPPPPAPASPAQPAAPKVKLTPQQTKQYEGMISSRIDNLSQMNSSRAEDVLNLANNNGELDGMVQHLLSKKEIPAAMKAKIQSIAKDLKDDAGTPPEPPAGGSPKGPGKGGPPSPKGPDGAPPAPQTAPEAPKSAPADTSSNSYGIPFGTKANIGGIYQSLDNVDLFSTSGQPLGTKAKQGVAYALQSMFKGNGQTPDTLIDGLQKALEKAGDGPVGPKDGLNLFKSMLKGGLIKATGMSGSLFVPGPKMTMIPSTDPADSYSEESMAKMREVAKGMPFPDPDKFGKKPKAPKAPKAPAAPAFTPTDNGSPYLADGDLQKAPFKLPLGTAMQDMDRADLAVGGQPLGYNTQQGVALAMQKLFAPGTPQSAESFSKAFQQVLSESHPGTTPQSGLGLMKDMIATGYLSVPAPGMVGPGPKMKSAKDHPVSKKKPGAGGGPPGPKAPEGASQQAPAESHDSSAAGVLGPRWNQLKQEGWKAVPAEPGMKPSGSEALGPLPHGKVQQLLEKGITLTKGDSAPAASDAPKIHVGKTLQDVDNADLFSKNGQPFSDESKKAIASVLSDVFSSGIGANKKKMADALQAALKNASGGTYVHPYEGADLVSSMMKAGLIRDSGFGLLHPGPKFQSAEGHVGPLSQSDSGYKLK